MSCRCCYGAASRGLELTIEKLRARVPGFLRKLTHKTRFASQSHLSSVVLNKTCVMGYFSNIALKHLGMKSRGPLQMTSCHTCSGQRASDGSCQQDVRMAVTPCAVRASEKIHRLTCALCLQPAEEAFSVTMHQRAWQSLAATTYKAKLPPQAASMLFAGYKLADLSNAQGVQG